MLSKLSQGIIERLAARVVALEKAGPRPELQSRRGRLPVPDGLSDCFLAKIKIESVDGCWIWTGPTRGNGYGSFGRHYAHRMMYSLTHGPIGNDLFVCHHCDNPTCVNPCHLFSGTASDNNYDAYRKKPTPRFREFGEDNPARKLTETEVSKIWESYYSGRRTQRELSVEFRVHICSINRIVHGDTWPHLNLSRPAIFTLKGSAMRGELSPRSKLTAVGVLDIRRRVSAGESRASVANSYGVSVHNISAIIGGRTWKDCR